MCPSYQGTVTFPVGRYFSMGSSRLTKPCFTMSAKIIVTNVFAMDARSKTVSPSTCVLFELEMFLNPKPDSISSYNAHNDGDTGIGHSNIVG